MIEYKDVLSFNYLKKQAFTGSYQGMRYVLKQTGDGKENPVMLQAVVWPEPKALAHTPEELLEEKAFPWSEEGRTEAIDWLNERYESRRQLWDSVYRRL